MRAYREQKQLAKEAREQHSVAKEQHYKAKERLARRAKKYTTVPEGILIYRLDTATARLELVSQPSSVHDHAEGGTALGSALVYECIVGGVQPAGDKSRRSLQITDATTGRTYILTACEQRTATAWLEAMQLMHAKKTSRGILWNKVRALVLAAHTLSFWHG